MPENTSGFALIVEHVLNNANLLNNLWARTCRAATAAAGVVVALQHIPNTEAEWAGMVVAVLGGAYTTNTRKNGAAK